MKIEHFLRWSFVEVFLLILTFILGMDANLYVNIPTTLTPAFWENSSTWIIRVHMILGTAILAIAILLLVNSFRFRYIKHNVKWPSIIGLISVVLAYVSGLTFLFLGANNFFSYLMAIGFLFAILSYISLAIDLRSEAR